MGKNGGKRVTDRQIAQAIEGFVRGFSFTRSFTHPYIPARVGPLWMVRDAERNNPRDYRNEEWITHRTPAKEVDRIIRQHTRGRFAICALLADGEADEPLRAEYKALTYRLGCTEPLMVHDLAKIPKFDSPAKIVRVTTQELSDRLTKAARSRQILSDHLCEDSPLRQYVAMIDERIVGWVRSIAAGKGRWVSNMYVVTKYRRKGIGRAMLMTMLRDDRKFGAIMSVLTASHTGAKLYPLLGYEQIALLYLFRPAKR